MMSRPRIENPRPFNLPLLLGPTSYSEASSCELLQYLTQGRFGLVYTGRRKGEAVVVKQIPIEKKLTLNRILAVVAPLLEYMSLLSKCYNGVNQDYIYETKAELIENEIRLLSRCQSKYVVKLLDVFVYKGQTWIVTRECLGSLENLFISSEYNYLQYFLQPDLACCLIFPIFQAVAHLNKLKIMHRDINLANILLTKDFIPVLSDFGTATEFNTEPILDGYNLGNGNNRSPEIWSIKPYNKSIDTWSIATCILQLVHKSSYFGILAPEPLIAVREFYCKEYEYLLTQKYGRKEADRELQAILNIDNCSIEFLKTHRDFEKFPERHLWIRNFLRKILVFSISERPSSKEVIDYPEFKEFIQSETCTKENILKMAKGHMERYMSDKFYKTLDNPINYILPEFVTRNQPVQPSNSATVS